MQKTGGGLDLACWLRFANPWWTRLTFPVVSPCFLNPLLCPNTTVLQNLLSCTLEPALNDPWCPPVLLGDTPPHHCHTESGRMDSTADLSCPLEATNLFYSFSVSLLCRETSRPHLFKPCASSSIQIITPSPSSPHLCSLLTLGGSCSFTEHLCSWPRLFISIPTPTIILGDFSHLERYLSKPDSHILDLLISKFSSAHFSGLLHTDTCNLSETVRPPKLWIWASHSVQDFPSLPKRLLSDFMETMILLHGGFKPIDLWHSFWWNVDFKDPSL